MPHSRTTSLDISPLHTTQFDQFDQTKAKNLRSRGIQSVPKISIRPTLASFTLTKFVVKHFAKEPVKVVSHVSEFSANRKCSSRTTRFLQANSFTYRTALLVQLNDPIYLYRFSLSDTTLVNSHVTNKTA